MPEQNNNQNWLVRLFKSDFVKKVWDNFIKSFSKKA